MGRKDNKSGRKPRQETVYAATRAAVTTIGVEFDPATGRISFLNDVDVRSEITYDRHKGPKVVSRIPQSANDAYIDEVRALESISDTILAVDTNTKIMSIGRVSVTGIVFADRAPDFKVGLNERWSFRTPYCLAFLDCAVDSEKAGWAFAIETLCRDGIITVGQSVCFIVDAHLGELDKINRRELPIIEGCMLPIEMTFAYASSDVGQDLLADKMIQAADTIATQCLTAIEKGAPAFSVLAENNKFHRGFCKIEPMR